MLPTENPLVQHNGMKKPQSASECRRANCDQYNLQLPAQTPSEPLSAVALARLNQADKGLGLKTTLACKHALHIVVAWYGCLLHALHGRVEVSTSMLLIGRSLWHARCWRLRLEPRSASWYSIAAEYRYFMKHAQALGQRGPGSTRGGT